MPEAVPVIVYLAEVAAEAIAVTWPDIAATAAGLAGGLVIDEVLDDVSREVNDASSQPLPK